jgi:predicted AAA+ superfamily ATPase
VTPDGVGTNDATGPLSGTLKSRLPSPRFQGKLAGTIPRPRELETLRGLLQRHPVVAIVGARQVGKTTLARMFAERLRGPSTRYDLEDPEDAARLSNPMVALRSRKGLVILDEVQRQPGLFQVLRVLADRRARPARFLVLGSASPELLKQSSETLAGRIAFHELRGLGLDEVGPANHARLWLRGGFPRSYVARSQADSDE